MVNVFQNAAVLCSQQQKEKPPNIASSSSNEKLSKVGGGYVDRYVTQRGGSLQRYGALRGGEGGFKKSQISVT